MNKTYIAPDKCADDGQPVTFFVTLYPFLTVTGSRASLLQ